MTTLKLLKFNLITIFWLVALPVLQVFGQPAELEYNVIPYSINSGIYYGNSESIELVWNELLDLGDVPWLRLQFSDANLGNESYIQIISAYDGSTQRLNSVSLSEWYNTSAFFNGGEVEMQLFVAPNDAGVFLEISDVLIGLPPEGGQGIESICGEDDNRISSSNLAVGRLLTVNLGSGCTGWIVENGKQVTAGHCVTGGSIGVLQFNVPQSLSNGTIQHPHPDHQYSVNQPSVIYTNSGVGNDWAVFEVFNNSNTNLQPIQAQNASFSVVQNNSSSQLRVTGYGVDGPSPYYGNPPPRNSNSQTQQTHLGSNVNSIGNVIRHTSDTQAGNSGGPIIDESTGNAIGIHTHGGCNTLGYNHGTSAFNTSFWNTLYPPVTVTVDQKRADGSRLSGTTIGRWNGTSFTNLNITENPATIDPLTGSTEVLRGYQEIVNNPFEKYRVWERNEVEQIMNIQNHRGFQITPELNNLTSRFHYTLSSLTLKNKLIELNDIEAGKLKFRDPWFINFNDPANYQDQFGFRNLGSNAIFEWVNSPFNPNTGSGAGSEYKGIFLNQDPALGVPTYSIESAPHNIFLSQTGRTHQFVWRSWDYDPTKVNIKSPNNKSTNVVFLSSANTTVTANLKGSQLSNELTAYDYNNQQKFVRTDNGHLHNVYISLGALWYERSTDGGTTWEIIGGQPVNSNNPKHVSIDYLGSGIILIAYQCTTATGSKVVIDVYINGAPRPGQFRYDVISFTHPPGEYSEMNAEPVISLAQEWDFLVVYKVPGLLPEGGDDPTTPGLYYSFGWLNGLVGWPLNWWNPNQKWVLIPTTGRNSIHATIGDDVYNGSNYFHIAYQENNQIKYYYRYGQTRTGSLATGGNPYVCSNNTGFSQHYNPSIISMGNTARVCWVGYRMVYYEENKEIDALPQYRVLFRRPGQTTFWQFGNNVSSPNINKRNDNTYYAFAWSENLNQIWFADNSLSTVRLIGDVTGQKLQVSNGPDKNNMYCMAYEHNTGAPFYLKKSNNLGSYYIPSKATANFFSSGREGVVSVDSSEFYFALGDIVVDGQAINFIEIPDTVEVNNLNSINQCLITEPITLSDNSNFIYSVQYGLNDSISAAQAITGERFINFKVLLVDDATGQLIGEYDNVTYTQNNLFQYNNIAYQVNTQGIGNRTARLKLVLDNNFESEYSLSRIFANESVLGKTTIKQISYSGSEVIKSYELSQNYPNPFNPTTIIKFQIPKSGNVTLKVYDILGNEITTLVDGFKEVGKFEVSFDASRLASGVYIYRLSVNDFVNVKKMVLLK